MNEIRLFLLGAHSPKAAILARFLSICAPQIELIGVDTSNLIKIFHSKYFNQIRHVEISQDDFRQLISEAGYGNGTNYLLPITSEWARNIYSLMKIDKPNVHVLQGSLNNFTALDNKGSFKKHVKNFANVPKLIDSLPESPSRFVIKPRIGSGSKGVNYFDSALDLDYEELKKHIESDEFLVEEYIEGTGVGIGGFAIDGKVVNMSSHKRIIEWPISGGSSAFREYFHSIELELVFSKVVANFNWTGFLMIEAKLTQDGRIFLIEANPRTWGGIHQFMLSTNFTSQFVDVMENSSHADRIIFESPRTYSSPLVYAAFFRMPLMILRKVFAIFQRDKLKKVDVGLLADLGGWIAQFLKN